jgi:hypothetical protein
VLQTVCFGVAVDHAASIDTALAQLFFSLVTADTSALQASFRVGLLVDLHASMAAKGSACHNTSCTCLDSTHRSMPARPAHCHVLSWHLAQGFASLVSSCLQLAAPGIMAHPLQASLISIIPVLVIFFVHMMVATWVSACRVLRVYDCVWCCCDCEHSHACQHIAPAVAMSTSPA